MENIRSTCLFTFFFMVHDKTLFFIHVAHGLGCMKGLPGLGKFMGVNQSLLGVLDGEDQVWFSAWKVADGIFLFWPNKKAIGFEGKGGGSGAVQANCWVFEGLSHGSWWSIQGQVEGGGLAHGLGVFKPWPRLGWRTMHVFHAWLGLVGSGWSPGFGYIMG